MAELVAVVLSALLPKALNAVEGRIDSMMEFRQQLESMKGHVLAIEAVLADAESKKTGSDSETVLLWLNTVSGVAFEAEIVLDKFLYESLRRQVLKSNGEVRSAFLFKLQSRIRDIYFSMMLSSRVQRINANFEKLNGQVTTLNLVSREHHAADHVAANRETNSLTDRFVEKRVEEEREIVKLLLDSSNNNSRVSVLPIFGLGGLGKTTLAKSVYNHPEIKGQFSKRSWTCVSDKVKGTDIFRGILESLKGGESVGDVSQQDAIVLGIQKELKGERFLFVLDDVWDFKWWEKFLNAMNHMAGLNSTGGGCCVLITTRSEVVANEACASPFRLKKLSDDQCWSIIVERVEEGEKMVEGLEVYKEQLLKKCQGLPLAANVIGGLLSRKDWSLVVDRILKIREEVDGEIGRILKLSYDHLPSRCIKKCFVYFSIYQKDARLDGEKLIELWMAEGFLQEDVRGGRTMEEVGADYLTILLNSSLLEKHHSWGSQYYFQMHDLIHDLAESFSGKQHGPAGRRHIVFLEGMEMLWNEKPMLAQKVEGEVSNEMLLKYRHARVMHFCSREIQKLPDAIGKLKHVRYLTLSLDGIKSLPESLCKLYNLQTLRLSDCEELGCLPQGLSNLISLRHLHFFRGGDFKMPPHMGRLTSLQTLKFFNVGEENGHRIKELGSLENLKGSLRIRNLELVKSEEEATSAKLGAKKNIIKLKLIWDWIDVLELGEDVFELCSTTGSRKGVHWEDEQVLEGLKPWVGLRELRIVNFMGIRLPRWLGELSALVFLGLVNCDNITQLGYSGDSGFPNLKSLSIDGCSQLSSLRISFPILERLKVRNIQVSGVRDIIRKSHTNSLQDLTLERVSGMRSLSDVIESSRLSSCLKKLYIGGCDELTEIPSSTLECCTCLESFKVSYCPELVSCPLQQTPSLSLISFSRCPKLFSRDAILPRGFEHLTNLKELEIGPDNSEQSINWDALKTGCSTTLRTLTMFGSYRTQLPQQLQDFSSLVELWISGFNSLERLPDWLGKLTSLQELRLGNCPKLEHLPTDAIRSLTNLQKLYIYKCPLLRETQRDEIKKALPNLQVYWTE